MGGLPRKPPRPTVRHLGGAGHFAPWYKCCFRLNAIIGDRIKVSTIGCYHPDGYPSDPEPIGAWYMFETKVFDMHDPERREIDSWVYDSEFSAQQGHEGAVKMWAERLIAGHPRIREHVSPRYDSTANSRICDSRIPF